MKEASKIPDDETGKVLTRAQFRDALERDIGHAKMWQAVVAFGDPKVSRSELRERFQQIAKSFPKSRYAKRAQATSKLLAKMIEEDKAHAVRRKARKGRKLSKREQNADWIHQLRDQNGHQWSQPGACDIFQDPRGDKSPASRLVRIGFDAVPQLIAIVDDKRFTRSVGYHRDFYFSHHVLRVGDCAVAILQDIAARSFYTRTYTNAAMIKDGQESKTKRAIKAWWVEVQRKGIKQVLIEGTEAGNDNSPAQAQRLLKKYPNAALPAIVKGARRTQDRWTRTSFVQIAAELKGKRVVAFLKSEMAKAPARETRVVAAYALHKRKQTGPIPAMIQEWRAVLAESAKPKPGDPFETDSGVSELIEFLATCGSPKAIQALEKDIHRHKADRRLDIIAAFGPDDGFSALSIGPGGPSPGGSPKTVSKPVRDAIESLLIGALSDTDVREGLSAEWGNVSFAEPRICDVAGLVLNQRDAKKYPFDIEASQFKRDQQRVRLINAWRKARKLKPLPLPKRIAIKRLPRDQVAGKLDAIVFAPNAAARAPLLAGYERLGLPALPALREQIAALPKKHAARSDLQAAAARLACLVTEIRFEKRRSARPGKALRTRLDALRNRPLTAEKLVDVLIATAANLPTKAEGIKLTAIRPGDGTGVTIVVELTTERIFQAGTQKGWAGSPHVGLGKKVLYSSTGGWSRDYGLTQEAHKDLRKALAKALAAPPDTPFMARAALIGER